MPQVVQEARDRSLALRRECEAELKALDRTIHNARRVIKGWWGLVDTDESERQCDDNDDEQYFTTFMPPVQYLVGRRVSIYWDGDERWYDGKIDQHDAARAKPHHVQYDDGEEEWWACRTAAPHAPLPLAPLHAQITGRSTHTGISWRTR